MLNDSRLIENNDCKLTNQLLTRTSCNLNQLLIKIYQQQLSQFEFAGWENQQFDG